MPFSNEVKETALIKSRRCCCVCHEFGGRYTNVHHIIPSSQGGLDEIDNAIVLCLRCHGEAGHYNPKHPIGNKYSIQELLKHRDLWWSFCENNPHKPLPIGPISISPTSFRLVVGEWQTKTLLKVHNKVETILYDVAIKFSVQITGVSIEKIDIEPKMKDYELSQDFGNKMFSGDLLRINGIDATGQQASVLYIHHIEPLKVLTFLISNSLEHPPQPNHNQHIIISLLGFSEDPSEMLVKENEAAIKFLNYDNWNITSVGVLLKKNH
jgi:hypothetical protein